MPGVRVDGNDILAVYSVCRAYADRIRSGQGPMLIEAYTYRMGAHTTADDPTKYRDSAEVDAWKPKDPILRVRKYLENTNDVDAAFFTAIDDEADALAERIRSACVNMEPPPVDEIFDSVFVEPHPMIEEEHREYKEYLASFEDVEGDN